MEHFDTDGDRSVFHIDGGALIWEVNGRPYAVVTKLTCNFEQRTGLFEVRNQNGGCSADYPEGVVRALKEMATMAGVNLVGDGWSHVGTQVAVEEPAIDLWEVFARFGANPGNFDVTHILFSLL